MKKIRGRINGESGWCSKINKLELETAEHEEETYVLEQDCKRVERNIELIENVSKQMKVEDGCVLDKDIKELQWLYSKHDRLQIMLAHLKHTMFLEDIEVRRQEDVEDQEIEDELDAEYNRKIKKKMGQNSTPMKKKKKEKKKKGK